MDSCAKHPHERGVGLCRRCGEAWCSNCLVYAFGQTKPPFCMSCAMFAGGVRTAAARPALPRRHAKALQKAAKAEAKATAKAAKRAAVPDPEVASVAAAAAVANPVHTPTTSDWETPWWEDRQPTFAD